jgi:hypothetical protein
MLLLAGLPLGLVLGVIRFRSNLRNFKKIVAAPEDTAPLNAAVRSVTVFIGRELLLLLALFIAMRLGRGFFAGAVAGTFIVPLAVLAGGFTGVKGVQ